MKKPKAKDLILVGVQFILLVLYAFPFQIMKLTKIGSISLIGFTLTIIGVLVLLISMVQLNKNLTPFPTPLDDGSLIETGLYKHIRHPIYTGILMLTFGFGLFQASFWKIFISLVLWALFYIKSTYEERLLLAKFPTYESYALKTSRFFPIPFIKNRK